MPNGEFRHVQTRHLKDLNEDFTTQRRAERRGETRKMQQPVKP